MKSILSICLFFSSFACSAQMINVRGLAFIEPGPKIEIVPSDSIDAVSDSRFHGKLQLKQLLKDRGAFLMEKAIITTNVMSGEYEANSFVVQKRSYLMNLLDRQKYNAYIKTIHNKEVFWTESHTNEMRTVQIQCGNDSRTMVFVGTIQINDRDSSNINGIVSDLIKTLKFKTP